MKKTITAIIILLVLAVSHRAECIEWSTKKENTIEWVAVSKKKPTDVINYVVYIADTDKKNQRQIGITDNIEYIITLTEEGRYLVGVQTGLKLKDESVIKISNISWSNDPLVVENEKTFGLQYFEQRPNPKGMKCLGF